MESDDDRLDSIRAVDHVTVLSAARASFEAIFDRQYNSVSMGDLDVESRSPALTCRSSDVVGMAKDEVLQIGMAYYRMLRDEPDIPAPGWTTIILRA